MWGDEQRLRKAAEHGNLEKVWRLLNKGVNVNAADNVYGDGSTPLHRASCNGHANVAELLMKHGANVNALNKRGWTPLDWASDWGHLDVARRLIENGAKVNATSKSGNTPLHRASYYGHAPVVQLLLDQGANVFSKNENDQTPLMWAREKKHAEVVSLLEDAEKKATQESPSMWSISYQQLMNVHQEASNKFKDSYQAMTMRDIVDLIIEPVCRETGTSYALYLNPSGLKTEAFVTHSWDEPFAEFVESIRKAFVADFEKPNLWICAFALVQGNKQTVAKQVDVPIDESPFVKALHEASLFVVARNPVTDLYTRIWCVCELIYAKKLGLVPRNTRVTGTDAFSNLPTSVVHAQASDPKDREKIMAVLSTEHKPEEIDNLVLKFRRHAFM